MARKPKPITCRHCGKELTVQTAKKRIREKSGIWYYCDERCNLAFFGIVAPEVPAEPDPGPGEEGEGAEEGVEEATSQVPEQAQ